MCNVQCLLDSSISYYILVESVFLFFYLLPFLGNCAKLNIISNKTAMKCSVQSTETVVISFYFNCQLKIPVNCHSTSYFNGFFSSVLFNFSFGSCGRTLEIPNRQSFFFLFYFISFRWI